MAQKRIIHNAQTKETISVDYTAEEQSTYDDYNLVDKINERKLESIKKIRLEKLKETDYLALDDVIMSDAMKTKRQEWRDIPSNYDSSKYDELLARTDGNLTHAIWSK